MNSPYLTKAFWVASFERALKTTAQTAVAMLAGASLNILTVDWLAVISVAAGSGVLSILTSIASARLGHENGPSLANEIVVEKADK
jgi:hypothetical protein